MAKNQVDKRIRFKAVDNVSAVVDRISSKFKKISKGASKAQKRFDRLEQSSKKLRASLSRVGSGMKSVGAGMSIGLTAPIVAFGVNAFQTAVVFDKSMNKVQALSRGSAKEIAALRKQSKLLGSETSFSASQAADAQAFFAQAGFKANEILKATPAALSLAASTSTDLAKSADILSNVMGGFNVKADKAGQFVDVLASVTARGNINMEMIGETMKDAAPVAQKYGATIQETAALTAKLGDAGIQGSKAGTTLKNMFLKLSAPSAGIKKIMHGLGVKAVDPLTGKMRKMTTILVEMNQAFKAKGIKDAKKLAILNEVFGKRAIAGAGVLLNAVSSIDKETGKTVNTVEQLEKQLLNSAGAAKKMEQIMLKGLPGATTSFTSAFEGLQLAVMDSGIKDFLEIIIRSISSVFRWISRLNPTALLLISIFAGLVAAIGPLVFIAGGIISALPFLISGFTALAVIFPALSIGLLPLILVALKFIAIATLLAAAGTLIYKNWTPIKEFFSDMFTKPLETIKDLFGWVGKFSGISGLLGFGDDTDEKLKAQGFKIKPAGAPVGDPTGSRELTKKSFEFKERQNNASVDVRFSNMPKDSRVITEDKESILNVLTGIMGAT